MKRVMFFIQLLIFIAPMQAGWRLGSLINDSDIVFESARRYMASGVDKQVDFLTDRLKAVKNGNKTIRCEYLVTNKGIILYGTAGAIPVKLFLDNKDYMAMRFNRKKNKSITNFDVNCLLESSQQSCARAIIRNAQTDVSLSAGIAHVYSSYGADVEFDLYIVGKNGQYTLSIR